MPLRTTRPARGVFRAVSTAALVAAVGLLILNVSAGATEMLPLDQLAPGDRCVARTVFRGTDIEEFDLEIIDIVPGHHPGGSLILGRALGERLEHTGIMQGMSGSPVYRDGRLIGAIAMSWSFSKDPIAGITPIEEMLPAFDILDATTGDAGGAGASYAAAFDRAVDGELSTTPIGILAATVRSVDAGAQGRPESVSRSASPAPTPLLVRAGDSGFLAGAADLLEPLGLAPVASWGGATRSDSHGRGGASAGAAAVEPGSAIGAQLVSGDIDMTAVGTVTHRDGDRVLAFGHPLFNAGPVELPMVAARIHASMPSLAVSFKFASGAEPVGTFLQDRQRVMAGRMGDVPDMLPVTVSVTVDGHEPTRYAFRVVRSTSYASLFTGLALADAVAEAARLSGAATVSLDVNAETDEGSVVYGNTFYTEGLPFRVGGETSALVELLLLNEFREGRIERLTVDVDVRSERRQVFIDHVSAERDACAPGDTLSVRIGLRDWQGDRAERTVELVVPRSADLGPAIIRVTGAAEYHMLEQERLGAGAYARSYDQILEAIADIRPENTVVAQLLSFRPGFSHRGREFSGVPGRATLVMAAGAGTGTVDRAEMTVLDEREMTDDRPVVGLHEMQITIVDETAGER